MARRTPVFLVLGILASMPAAAQKASPGQVAYVDGVRAFDAGDYATAAGRMRIALAEDPVEATARFRYRAQNAEDYFPHLWLGLSLEKLGDRQGALPHLEESRRQGAVAARPALQRILTTALARLTPATPVPEIAAGSPLPSPTTGPEELPPPGPSAAAIPAIPTILTTRPTTGPAVAAGGPARRSPQPAAIATVAPAPPATAASAVRSGLRAFFRGDYGGAEALLAPEAGRRPVARVFLAWSLGGQYLLAGSRDPGLLARARSEYAAALLDGAPSAGGQWVSPSILALFGAAEAVP
jgi:hypothetical protein